MALSHTTLALLLQFTVAGVNYVRELLFLTPRQKTKNNESV